MDACHIFPQCLLAIISLKGGDWYCGDKTLLWVLRGASSLLCGCYLPVRSRVCYPVVGIEAPISISELCCEVGRTGTLLLEWQPLSILLQELSTGRCTLWCCLSLVFQAHNVHFCSHCPWPCLSCGKAGSHPGYLSRAVIIKATITNLQADPPKSGTGTPSSHAPGS